ncbi:CidA/LrgA family protein [Helcococcus sueciensis]|uniref:CidA/LrgA family protein n=1 Tax=Helcococcus sueciensis TaxID=241555 RepID=UPI000425D58C|nr:CidA/LrgA family protein [Helcococcus sueciensis]
MKYIKQVSIIFTITFMGEILKEISPIPFPIPSSVYGLILMLLALTTKIIKLDDVKESAYFLISIMPIMFIPPAINLITVWPNIQSKIIAYFVICIISTLIVMISSGVLTQKILNNMENKNVNRKY